MKYLFDVTCQPNRTIIKVEISAKPGTMPIYRTVVFEDGNDNEEPDLSQLFNEIIDNMRLTVKEREEAKYESKILKDYLQKYSNEDHSNDANKLILE